MAYMIHGVSRFSFSWSESAHDFRVKGDQSGVASAQSAGAPYMVRVRNTRERLGTGIQAGDAVHTGDGWRKGIPAIRASHDRRAARLFQGGRAERRGS